MWSWEVRGNDGLGATGVTDDQGRAEQRLGDALQAAPAGTTGSVHRIGLHPAKPQYEYGRPVATAEVTEAGVRWL
ncbi:hypothetical protein DPM19_11845 [Actinomadura craniellae]|uniref:Uncharacterized protein n=2 Tax=Actinomadura craniellae TaxID=2231787 RepID=A0A365H8D5_9ACTN|nr:hypothetical protein DPM19_11845 [Actinomadura craniellae]